MSFDLSNLYLALPAFLTAVVDIMFGMGFGLTMTPILVIAGFGPHQIVPALLFSSLLGNVIGPFFHHRLKNVDFRCCTRHFMVSIVIGGLGVVGSVLGAFVSVGISDFHLGLYIGLLVTALGLFLLLNRRLRTRFSWSKLVALGLFGSFNKGISGSGYGPIVTTGMIFMDIDEKAAVSIQTFSELFVSLAGFVVFVLSGAPIAWELALPLSIGVVASSPLAAFAVHRFESSKLRIAIAAMTVVLGAATLLRLVWR
jgi:hypothetical protein